MAPETSSIRRPFIPMGFIDDKGQTLASSLVRIAPQADLYHFGVLMSSMHMAWVRTIGGRLKSDYRYSVDLDYNPYPWPSDPPPPAIALVEKCAQGVLDARAKFPEANLADLYDPNTMPPVLAKAHNALDKAVDKAYGQDGWKGTDTSDLTRAKFLFGLYDALVTGVTTRKTKAKANPKRK